METLKFFCISILAAVVFCFCYSIVWAVPSADFMYLEQDLGGGLWQYDYTLFNTSDPIADAGCDLYDVLFDFDFFATINAVQIPTGWMEMDGAGFARAFSVIPGPPPFGADIAPGTSLSGFVFQFDYQAGDLPFHCTLVNPSDPPFVYSDTSALIPEPSTILLLGLGLISLLVSVKKRIKT